MRITNPSATEHAAFRTLVNAEIRPAGAVTEAWDDFPLILSPDNAEWTLVVRDAEGQVAAGLSALIREFTTNCGKLHIAGLGSVVTRPDQRGRPIF